MIKHFKIIVVMLLVLAPAISFAGDYQTIKGPIDILDVWIAKDGGTISISFKDSENELFEICRDKRLDYSPHYTYIGGMYPTEKNAIKIDHGSSTEKLLVHLLKQWVSIKESQLEKLGQKAVKIWSGKLIWLNNLYT